jgi:hypothetical protein
LASILAGLMLASCSPSPIRMAVTDVGGRKVVTLFTTNLFGMRSSEAPCIRRIEVSSFNAVHEAEPAWTAETPDEVGCVHLRAFVIGQAPPRFRETRRLPAGALHGPYRIEVRGIGTGAYDVVF